jgi:hypothetical protein
MVKLLDDGDNILTQVQSTDAITAGSVLKLAKKRADELSTTTGKTILPTFTNTRAEAQEEADRLNVINQSIHHRRKGGRCRGSIKTGWQRHHRCHSTNGGWKRL